MTVSDPTNMKSSSRSAAQNKRKSLDMKVNQKPDPTMPVNDTTSCNCSTFKSSSTGQLSLDLSSKPAFMGDIQVVKSPPTPEGTSQGHESANSSVGDISIHSLPTPPSGSSPSSSAGDITQEIRHKFSNTKIMTIKDDIDKSWWERLKSVKDNLCESMDEWKSKHYSKVKADTRTIKVEFTEMKRPSRQRSFYKNYKHQIKKNVERYEEDDFELPDHNVSPALILTSLKDCTFSAHVPVIDLPDGDITLRISGYQIVIIVNRKRSRDVDHSHRIVKPFKYGEIDIPIYVDPSTLQFEYDRHLNILRLQAKMKGHSDRNYSLSNDDLRVIKESRDSRRHKRCSKAIVGPRPIERQLNRLKNNLNVNSSDDVFDDDFRDRAYTK